MSFNNKHGFRIGVRNDNKDLMADSGLLPSGMTNRGF